MPEQNNNQQLLDAMRARAVERFGDVQIHALEKIHGKLTLIEVEDKMGLFKQPDRKLMSAASVTASTDPMEYVAMIADNCLVEGDRELIEVDTYFFAIVPLINELIETKTATLLKL